MILTTTLSKLFPFSLIEQINIVTILTITIAFFIILLVLGIMKSRKLKAENDRLSKPKSMSTSEDNKVYRDFREGHLYDNY